MLLFALFVGSGLSGGLSTHNQMRGRRPGLFHTASTRRVPVASSEGEQSTDSPTHELHRIWDGESGEGRVRAAALGGSTARFKQFVEYLAANSEDAALWREVDVVSTDVNLDDENARASVRQLWDNRSLLVYGKQEYDSLMQSHTFEQQLVGYIKRLRLLNASDGVAMGVGSEPPNRTRQSLPGDHNQSNHTVRTAVRAFLISEWGAAQTAAATFEPNRPHNATLAVLKVRHRQRLTSEPSTSTS